MQRILFSVAIVFFFSTCMWGQTNVPATIVENTTFTKLGSPYLAEQSFTISSGVTLKIEAGVQVLLANGISISNNGRMLIEGTENESVLFSTNSETDRWKYIYNNGTFFAHGLHIDNAVRFIYSYGDTVVIKNCYVANTYGGIGDDCIGVHNALKVVIRDSYFEGNPESGKTDGLDLDNISGDTIRGNTIKNFSDDGIDIGTGSSDVFIAENVISNCDMGISIGENTSADVNYNLVTYCAAGMQSHTGSVVTAKNNTLFGNYIGLRLYHNSSEETSGGTLNISNSIISHCRYGFMSTKANSVLSASYCMTDSELLTGEGNLTGDAAFVDTLNGNFLLSSGSIAIDAGDPDSDGDGVDYNSDIDDRDPDDSRKDLGCYPFFNSVLRIIEVSPSNLSMLKDEDGNFPDWIKIYNQSETTVNLNGYYLSDNPSNLMKYKLAEDILIPSGDTLLFWADNTALPFGNHLPFKLSGEGESVVLASPEGTMVDQILFSRVPIDYIYRRVGLSSDWVYVTMDESAVAYSGLCSAPAYLKPGGASDFSTSIELVEGTDGEQLFYTVNGDSPEFGSAYISAIDISEQTTIRTLKRKDNFVPSYTHSEAYFAAEEYTLPVMSLSTDHENLYGDLGIYTKYGSSGPLWERPSSYNYYNDTEHFGAIAGIRIQGGNSVKMAKKSFRLHFRGGYGASRLQGSPFAEGPESFKNLVLRSGYDDDITTSSGTMLRDPFSTDLWKKLGELATESTFNVLLLNNNYWGIYNVRESINNYFVEDHLGRDDFDLIRFQKWGADLKYGTMDSWNILQNYFNTKDFTKPEVYEEVKGFMDMNSLLNLLSLVHCSQFRSWTWGAFAVKPADGKWTWTIWDADRSYSTLSWNGFTEYANTSAEKWPNFIPQELIKNELFRRDLVNRNCDLLNSLFVSEKSIAIYDSLVAVVEPEMEAEFERWNPGKFSNWEGNNNSIKSFLISRPTYLYDQMKAYFSLNDTAKITIRIEGEGSVVLNSLTIEESEWSGIYMEGNSIDLVALPHSGSVFIGWENISLASSIEIDPAAESVIVARFQKMDVVDRLPMVINEIMYHPVSDVESEWIEVYNPNDFSISLDGFTMRDGGDGNQFALYDAIIEENGYLVVAGDLNDFSAQFSDLQNVVGGFNSGDLGFKLSNAGETIYLYNLSDEIEDSVAYFDRSPWPVHADGFGPSLQLISPDLNNNLGLSWITNNVHYVTPGRSNNINDVEAGIQHTAPDILMYPNPAKEILHIKLSVESSVWVKCQIYSISGVLLNEMETLVSSEKNIISWQHGLGVSGAYLLRLVGIDGDVNTTEMFIFEGR